MNLKNSIEINKEDIIGKIIKVFIMFLIIFFVIVFFNRCGSVVYAEEVSNYSYGESELSFEDLSVRFINGEDDSDGVEYYYEEPQSFFIMSTKEDSTKEDERKYFDEYPYWFFYKNRVYASDYPFHFNENNLSIETPVEEYGLNFEFYSFNLGVFKTGSVFSVYIPSAEHHLVKSNYEIVDFPIDDYVVSGKNFERNIYNDNLPVLNFGYYTFSSIYSDRSFYFYKASNNNFYLQQYPYNSARFYYSYLGSDLILSSGSGDIYRIGIGPITDEDLWRFYVSSNKNIPYDGVEGLFDSGYLSVMDSSLMPDGWTPTFDDFVPFSSDNGGGNEDEDESGSILDYINPFSNKFFLKIAFVPSDDFFPNQVERVISSNEGLLHSFDNVISSLETIFSTEFGTEEFEGIDYGDRKLLLTGHKIVCNADNYDTVFGLASPSFCAGHPNGLGDLEIAYKKGLEFDLSDFKLLDASYIAPFISRFRYYMSGIMNLFFILWLVRWLLSFFGYHAPEGGYNVNGDKPNPIGFNR